VANDQVKFELLTGARRESLYESHGRELAPRLLHADLY
jgi:hypothetical protein